jgi:MFS superfamily sulfate permease-like transporter
VLELIPTSSLAGLLVVVGVRLVSLHHIRALARQGFGPLATYGTTLVVILCTNLLTGVVAGVALHLVLRKLPRIKEAVLS